MSGGAVVPALCGELPFGICLSHCILRSWLQDEVCCVHHCPLCLLQWQCIVGAFLGALIDE